MTESFDHIVVGAGSAGAVVACRLADAGAKVLLLEAGGTSDLPNVRIPAMIDTLLDSPLDWGYRTVAQPELAGRRIFLSRGKCLGGTSAINAMVYMRGNRGDYDRWAALGNAGWGYDDVLPHFRKSEGNRQFRDTYHGTEGPLTVSSFPSGSVIHEAFLRSAQDYGLPFNPDVNGASQEGCGPFQATIGPQGRCSTAVAFLDPLRRAKTLHILTEAQVTRVRIEAGRAVGVEYIRNGQSALALAGEVILSGGAINSPQLLMLSGIGDAGKLQALGIVPTADLPGVGQNLQDHLQIISRFETAAPVTLFGMDSAEAETAWHQSLHEGRGRFHTNFCEAGAFLRCDPASADPDVQIHCEANFGPFYFDGTPADRHGFGLIVNVCRPESRGEVRLHSSNPLERPVIDPRYLTDGADLALTIKGVRACLEIAAQAPLQAIGTSSVNPGPEASDAEIEAFIRLCATTIWHPVGTAKMGHDAMAVVDDRLCVHGIAGLRVADASVMPDIVSGNTNAACIMIGEKAADLIMA